MTLHPLCNHYVISCSGVVLVGARREVTGRPAEKNTRVPTERDPVVILTNLGVPKARKRVLLPPIGEVECETVHTGDRQETGYVGEGGESIPVKKGTNMSFNFNFR